MTNRISIKDLEGLVNRLNTVTGNNQNPWNRETKKSNIGTYTLDGAYGGWALYQIDNESGGVRDISQCGHASKRELYSIIRSYLNGIEAKGGNHD